MSTIITPTTQGPKRLTAIDEVNGNLTYIGFAKLGSGTDEAKWQIFRINKTGSVTLIQYADGDVRFNNIWDNRASLSYTN